MKGWHGNSYAHYLASKGISVRQIKDIHNFPDYTNYNDPEEFIVAFWLASIKNDFSDFDFDEVFRYTKDVLKKHMNRYGYLSFEEFYNDYNYDNVLMLAEDYIYSYEWFAEKHEDTYYKNKVTREMAKDIYDMLNNDREESWAGVDPTYDKLFEVYKELQNNPKILRGKIILMDKLVDLQHHRASIWVDNNKIWVDVEKLRNEFETNLRRVR